MRTIRVATVLALCWSGALAAPVPKERDAKPPYYPTKVGTKLVYDYQEAGELIFVVTEVKEIKGGKRVTVERRDLKEPIIGVVEVTETGLVQVEHSGELDPPVVILPLPVRAGDKWSYKLAEAPRSPGVDSTHTVVGVEKIKVPAGTFEAVRVDTEFKATLRDTVWHYKYSRWYAPHVGLVQEKMADEKLVAVLKSVALPKE